MPAPLPQRFLITGGRGRLATLIAEHFRAAGGAVELYSREAGDGFRSLADLAKSSPLQESDMILHLAWSTLPATSEKNPGQERQHDLPLLENLLASATASRAHFVFFSSGGAVYGNAPGRPNREDDSCHPIGCYGRAKLAAETVIEQAASRHGLRCTILRISNPYGYPVPRGRAQGIIPHAIRCAVEGQPLTLWGDGHAQKDFLHHTDFLAALDAVIGHQLTGRFNLSYGESHTVHEIITLVEKQTDRKIMTQAIAAPIWDVQDSRLDHSRLSAASGWRPRVPLEEGIRRAVQGYRGQ
jgi:UDP-glucose 4-epimerase